MTREQFDAWRHYRSAATPFGLGCGLCIVVIAGAFFALFVAAVVHHYSRTPHRTNWEDRGLS